MLAVEMTNERIIDLTLYNILHISSFYSNFISISKIYSLGLAITFSENNIVASFRDKRIAIYRVLYRRLYHVKIVGEPKVLIVSLVQKLCSMDG